MDSVIRKFAPNFHHLMLLDKQQQQQQQNSWMISGGGRAAGRPSEISLSAVITAKLFPNFADSLIRPYNSPEQAQESEVQVKIGCQQMANGDQQQKQTEVEILKILRGFQTLAGPLAFTNIHLIEARGGIWTGLF